MATSTPSAAAQRLLDEYDVYDQHVDVVSAFEWLFTKVTGLPDTVARFERFPRIPRAGGGDPLTPDFTVLFHDGTAIIGEIAKIALHDNSIDKLCHQIGNYDALTQVPNAAGGFTPVQHPDVLQLVHTETGLSAVRRIITERYLDPGHPYKPSRPPVISQFSRSDTVYTFQRLPNQENGALSKPHGRTPNIADYLDNDLHVKAERFVGVKIARGFINDPIPALYLATHLWTRTWPTQYGSGKDDIEVQPAKTTELLQDQYDHVRARDVKRALELLEGAGLARRTPDGTWTVTRKLLGRSGDRDVHQLIAGRIGTEAKPIPLRPAPRPKRGVDTLF